MPCAPLPAGLRCCVNRGPHWAGELRGSAGGGGGCSGLRLWQHSLSWEHDPDTRAGMSQGGRLGLERPHGHGPPQHPAVGACSPPTSAGAAGEQPPCHPFIKGTGTWLQCHFVTVSSQSRFSRPGEKAAGAPRAVALPNPPAGLFGAKQAGLGFARLGPEAADAFRGSSGLCVCSDTQCGGGSPQPSGAVTPGLESRDCRVTSPRRTH